VLVVRGAYIQSGESGEHAMDNESEYYKRYGKNEKHSFDGVRGPKIPCKYPERGPMLYEVMEYYADATRAMNASHQVRALSL
jgi:hypothetical protein